MKYWTWKELKKGDTVRDREGARFEIIKIWDDDFADIAEVIWNDEFQAESLDVPFRAYRKDYIK